MKSRYGGVILLCALAQLAPFAQALNITRHTFNDTPLAPSPLPRSHADSDGNQIIENFQRLGRTTTWKFISNITLQGDSYEPEGIVRLGADRYIVSSTEYESRTGYGRLTVFSGNGNRIADVTLSQPGDLEYHNGGIDYDGKYIWATIAQYRPNSSAKVMRVDPETLGSETVLRYNDHLGGIVHDVQTDRLYTLNWGSRNESIFDLRRRRFPFWWSFGQDRNVFSGFRTPNDIVRNPSYFVDYQDCKFLGHARVYNDKPVMLCSGVANRLGGLAIVGVEDMVALAEIPVTLTGASGVLLTQNPMDVSVEDGRLRFYFAPDSGSSVLYVVEAQP
ncbi:uncharacterized protein K489DRAFT_323318 [Dissoconium aciculare CBS 342.82]|uniref:Calcium-dependent phosphotriesterase n=1 Tax=Dissoconium aciculare CBS 342.82 TaxID=1314786 RepID=A0A6J3LYJ0_9PEZI|nr:uncharacterized protein K489DRAFT_323318 [Dissoconium aciculare CBS 342.82]KAF1820826.1 hypothetical protein K489DRAFT_323318 [Dissoconium aciculare CBS 342.82]